MWTRQYYLFFTVPSWMHKEDIENGKFLVSFIQVAHTQNTTNHVVNSSCLISLLKWAFLGLLKIEGILDATAPASVGMVIKL